MTQGPDVPQAPTGAEDADGRDVEHDRLRPVEPQWRHRWRRLRRSGARGRTVAAGSILAVWGISTFADIWSSAYSPPEGLNTVALAAATYLFGSAFLKENK